MNDYHDATFGERIASVYDDYYGAYDPAAIDLLAELAGPGPVLELGIGTGRIALPLQARGVEVQGIDASAAMVARLRAKPRGDEIEVHAGSFEQFEIDRRFRLVFVVFNTFFGLLTQEAQVRCFQSVRRHLAADGLFLLELFVPDPCRFEAGQTIRAIDVTSDRVRLDATLFDPLTQQVTSQHVLLSEEGVRLWPVKLRFAWPSELDLMARLAGLSLRHRWGSWSRGDFTRDSKSHISIYGPAAPG
jgi:SAM-dependent methyltransferase